MSTSLSVVVPAYNEGERLAIGLQRLMSQVPQADTEIIVVDDGSTDDTVEVGQKQLAGWPHGSVVCLPRNAGKGAAVRAGVLQARGATIAFMDADMATDLGDLATLLGALETHQVAVGCRSHAGSEVGKRGLHRAVMNRVFGMLVASMTELPYTDTQCGFKAFDGPIAKLLFHGSRIDRFAFDVELMDLAARLGLRTAEVPVHWTDVPGSHVRPVHDGLQMLGDVTRMRLNRWGQPPIDGVLLRDIAIETAATQVSPHVRSVDLVMAWEEGTAVLFPCLTPATGRRVTERLVSEFGAFRPEPVSIEFRSVASPTVATELRSRALKL